jgi:hypothetical protein
MQSLLPTSRSETEAVKRDCSAFTDADRAWIAAHPELSSVLEQCDTGELYTSNSPGNDHVGACNEGSIGCRRRRVDPVMEMVRRDCAAFTHADRAWIAAHPELSSVLGQCETGELYAASSPDEDHVGACNEGSIGCRRRREVES